MVTKTKDFSITTYVEVRTGTGQLLEVQCVPKEAEQIKELFGQLATLEIKEPATKQILLAHGGYGGYTRYDVTQYKYAGGGYPGCGGYIEVLEIKNPPDGRCGNVLHEFRSGVGHEMFEFESIEAADEAFETAFHGGNTIRYQPGFIRQFQSGWLQPWFYAVGDQRLLGDFVFPNIFSEDDIVFRVGRKFVVADSDGNKTIKICLGSRLIEKDISHYYVGEKKKYLLVQWLDDSQWDEYRSSPTEKPQPLDEVEPSVAAALDMSLGKFQELMPEGKHFTLSLPTGQELVCRIRNKQTRRRKRK